MKNARFQAQHKIICMGKQTVSEIISFITNFDLVKMLIISKPLGEGKYEIF